MEDAATAEISRSQVWQWVHHAARLADGTRVTRELVERIEDEELARLRAELGPAFGQGRFDTARVVFEQVALSDEFVPFLTLPAYQYLD
jgi:malate synthase